jgi:PAS domain S-box-containing protein/putative nucleotidyltransferase with HDIG domain
MNGMPIYNSRIVKNYVEYLGKYHPDISIGKILDYAGISTYQVEDEGHWFTQTHLNRFHEIISELTGNPNISREVGRHSAFSAASGALKQYLLGFLTPATAYALVDKVAANVNRGKTFRTRNIGPHQVEVEVTLQHDIQEQVFQCENRIGSLEAMGKVFSDKFAEIEHPACLHRGDDRCVYRVRWDASASFIWKRLRNYIAILGLPVCATLLFFIPPLEILCGSLIWLALVLGISFHAERFDRLKLSRSVANQEDVAGRLLDQINISYNNALLVQEIGQATSSLLDIDRLLLFITEALEKRLDFDRGMIMLANREKTRLVYTIGYGYAPEQLVYLKNVEFHLDNPDSRGVFVISFKKQTPYLINDLTQIEKDISQRSLAFAKKMCTHCFICVPIIFKGDSLGVLVVDNIKSKRLLSQSDMSLLMGIAPQIAISINNAVSYRKIAESEKRFRSLSESTPDIIYMIDTRGIFTYVNPAWERILGHTNEEVLGRYFIDFVRKEELPIYTRLFRMTRSEGITVRDIIGTIIHKDGSDRFFSISGAPNLDSDGKAIGVVGTFKDLTDLMLSEAKLKQSYAKLQNAMDSTIQAISMIVESRDPYTSGHQERVAKLAREIAQEMGLSDEQCKAIHMAAVLHDIGKIQVPAEILSKPKILNNIEMDLIRQHPDVGFNILQSIQFPYPIARIVLQHHERMDGTGYPAGLIGENILLEARILAVADVVEAIASHRPYRPALGIEKALKEIDLNRGILYDDAVVEACLRLFSESPFVLSAKESYEDHSHYAVPI